MIQGEYRIIRNDHEKAQAVAALVDVRPDKDNPVAIKFEPYKKKRSDLQNRYLWGWIYDQIARQLDEAGIVIHCDDGTEHPYTKDVLHEIFKQKFLAIGTLEAKGRSLPLYESTTGLNKKQFSEFTESVRGFVWQFWGITVADPNAGYWQTIAKEIR